MSSPSLCMNENMRGGNDPDVALMKAIEAGRLEDVRYIVQNYNVNLNKSYDYIEEKKENDDYSSSTTSNNVIYISYSFTPVKLACKKGFLEIVKLLIDSGANIPFWRTIAECAYPDIVKYYKHELINQQNNNKITNNSGIGGMTPLHLAVNSGYLYCDYEGIIFLLQIGNANPNIRDNNGMTPLHYACMRADITSVQYLVTMGSNKSINNIDLNAPREEVTMVTTDRDKNTTPLSRPKNGAFFGKKLPKGSTPLHFACLTHCGIDTTTQNDEAPPSIQVVRFLINHGADMTARNDMGDTPLHVALTHIDKLASVASALIDIGGPKILHIPNYKNKNKNNNNNKDETISTKATITTTIFEGNPYRFPFTEILWKRFPLDFTLLVQSHPIIIHALPKPCLEFLVNANPKLLETITSFTTKNLPIHDACTFGSRRGCIDYMITKYPKGLQQYNARGRLPFHEACTRNGIVADENDDDNCGSSRRIVLSKILKHHQTALIERDAHGRLPFEIAITNNNVSLNVIFFLLKKYPPALQELL